MIHNVHGSVLEGLPKHSIIMHQVNCLGVAGAGVALQIKKAFPGWFDAYHSHVKWFQDGKFDELLGTFHQFKVSDDLIVCSAFAQGGISKAQVMTDYNAWLEICKKVVKDVERQNLASGLTWTVHVPYGIGCGLGGGDWNRMMDIFKYYFEQSPVDLYIHKL